MRLNLRAPDATDPFQPNERSGSFSTSSEPLHTAISTVICPFNMVAVGQSETSQAVAKDPSNMEAAQPSATSNTESEAWDEERIEDALKTLKEMYIQLRGLRTTIPRLIAPLTSKQPSPEVLLQEFVNSSRIATQEVQQFRRLLTDEKTTEVLEHARTSRAQNPKGIKPWRITDEPDWNVRDN